MLTVNGRKRPVDVMKQETLAMMITLQARSDRHKAGCDRAECGNCTVLIDNVPRYACSVLTHSVRHAAIRTIEGLAKPGWHPPPRARSLYRRPRAAMWFLYARADHVNRGPPRRQSAPNAR